MVISKQEQITARRAEVWNLFCQGLTQQEISKEFEKKYHVSQQTISIDIRWLKEHYVKDFMKDHRKKIAEEYAKVMSNLEQLRAKAWKQFNSLEDDNNSTVKTTLYDTLLKINNNILVLLSIGDSIELESKIIQAKDNAQEIKQEMNKLTNELRNRSQAVF